MIRYLPYTHTHTHTDAYELITINLHLIDIIHVPRYNRNNHDNDNNILLLINRNHAPMIGIIKHTHTHVSSARVKLSRRMYRVYCIVIIIFDYRIPSERRLRSRRDF